MDPAIYLLHADVLVIIYDYLSLVDKACFALSCKRYYGLFAEATKEEAFEFPTFHKIQAIKALRPYVDQREVPRNQLLIRLEDSRWALCGDGCEKLHPRREFPEYNLSKPPWKRNCGFNTGIVDLCPCFWLTFRERDKVIRALQYPSEGFNLKKPLTLIVDEHGEASLQHSCSIDTFVDGELVATTSIKINLTLCGHGFFMANTDYVSEYHVTQYQAPQYRTQRRIEKEAEPIFVCPHKNLFTFNNGECGDCHSDAYSSQSGYYCTQPITVTVKRILGHTDWRNDCVWSRNCRHMSYDFFSWHYCPGE